MFDGTHDTNTFEARRSADLYLATQFPGQFADPTGRVQTPLQVYDGADDGFAVLVVVWRGRSSAPLQEMAKLGDPFGLLGTELGRQERPPRKPEGWEFLWFLGVSDIFGEADHHGARCIHCRTRGNVGILQKDVVLPLTPDTELRWDWMISTLPSRLREDTSASHDSLSIAVEFENGRDITYHWSWELPQGYGAAHLAGPGVPRRRPLRHRGAWYLGVREQEPVRGLQSLHGTAARAYPARVADRERPLAALRGRDERQKRQVGVFSRHHRRDLSPSPQRPRPRASGLRVPLRTRPVSHRRGTRFHPP